MRVLVFSLTVMTAAAALAGCASQQTGPTYASIAQTNGAPKAGNARIVVMRSENGFGGWGDRGLPVKIDDRPIGELMTGTFVSADVPAGRHQLSSDLWDFPGAARQDLNAAAGRTYFFEAKVAKNVQDIQIASVFGGLAGMAVAMAATGENHGGIVLAPMDEGSARQVVATLRQAQ